MNSLYKPAGRRHGQLDAVHLPVQRRRREQDRNPRSRRSSSRPTPTSAWSSRRTATRSTPTGGKDDAVYYYTKTAGTFALGGTDRARTTPARASAPACSRTPAASASRPTARRWSSPTTTTTPSASSTPPRASRCASSTTCARSSPATKALTRRVRRHLPVRRRVVGQRQQPVAYVVVRPRPRSRRVNIYRRSAGRLIKRIKLDGNGLGMTLNRRNRYSSHRTTPYVAVKITQRQGRGDRRTGAS